MEQITNNGNGTALRTARALGWFSIGLGAAELFAPRAMARLIGVSGHKMLIRSMGVREIALGIGILRQQSPTEAMAARVAGDAVDLSLLGAALANDDADKKRLSTSLAVVSGITALDLLCTAQLGKTESEALDTVQTIAVNRSPEECREFWRNFENFPRFMKHVESVQSLSDSRSHWVVNAPAGFRVEWDAEITEDSPNRIAWHSLPGADVENSGTVEFRNGTAGHGTIVKAYIRYKPPAGQIGASVARLFGEEPGIQAKTDLRRFKAVMETGEVPTIEGQSSGRLVAQA